MLVDAPGNETPVAATNETPVAAITEMPVVTTTEMPVVTTNQKSAVPNNEEFIILSPQVVAVASNTSTSMVPINDYQPFPPDCFVKYNGKEIFVHDGDLKMLPQGPAFFKWAIKNLLGPDVPSPSCPFALAPHA